MSTSDVVVARAGEDFDVVEEATEENDKGYQETVGQKRVDSMLKDFTNNSTKFDIAKEK